jgi:hypothetical protein
MEIQTEQWNIQMTRLVGVYLDSCCRDEGEGLPKIPEQPNGDTVGQLVEIEVADIFCMF